MICFHSSNVCLVRNVAAKSLIAAIMNLHVTRGRQRERLVWGKMPTLLPVGNRLFLFLRLFQVRVNDGILNYPELYLSLRCDCAIKFILN